MRWMGCRMYKNETYLVAFYVGHVEGVGNVLGHGALTAAGGTGDEPYVVVLGVRVTVGGHGAVGAHAFCGSLGGGYDLPGCRHVGW